MLTEYSGRAFETSLGVRKKQTTPILKLWILIKLKLRVQHFKSYFMVYNGLISKLPIWFILTLSAGISPSGHTTNTSHDDKSSPLPGFSTTVTFYGGCVVKTPSTSPTQLKWHHWNKVWFVMLAVDWPVQRFAGWCHTVLSNMLMQVTQTEDLMSQVVEVPGASRRRHSCVVQCVVHSPLHLSVH